MVNPGQSGFTLIELMITIAIVGILAGIGLPAMQNSMLNQRVRTAASDTHVSLLMTRSEAIKRGKNVNMTAGGNWEDGWNIVVPADSITVQSQDAFDSVTFACDSDLDGSADTCPSSVSFNRVGRPVNGVEFWIYVTGNTSIIMRCVSISLSGVPKIAIDNDSDQTNGCN